jgi:hypothetical protein
MVLRLHGGSPSHALGPKKSSMHEDVTLILHKNVNLSSPYAKVYCHEEPLCDGGFFA